MVLVYLKRNWLDVSWSVPRVASLRDDLPQTNEASQGVVVQAIDQDWMYQLGSMRKKEYLSTVLWVGRVKGRS